MSAPRLCWAPPSLSAIAGRRGVDRGQPCDPFGKVLFSARPRTDSTRETAPVNLQPHRKRSAWSGSRRPQAWIAWCALIALTWSSVGILPTIALEVASRQHASAHRHDDGHAGGAAHEHHAHGDGHDAHHAQDDFSDIPGSPDPSGRSRLRSVPGAHALVALHLRCPLRTASRRRTRPARPPQRRGRSARRARRCRRSPCAGTAPPPRLTLFHPTVRAVGCARRAAPRSRERHVGRTVDASRRSERSPGEGFDNDVQTVRRATGARACR